MEFEPGASGKSMFLGILTRWRGGKTGTTRSSADVPKSHREEESLTPPLHVSSLHYSAPWNLKFLMTPGAVPGSGPQRLQPWHPKKLVGCPAGGSVEVLWEVKARAQPDLSSTAAPGLEVCSRSSAFKGSMGASEGAVPVLGSSGSK